MLCVDCQVEDLRGTLATRCNECTLKRITGLFQSEQPLQKSICTINFIANIYDLLEDNGRNLEL